MYSGNGGNISLGDSVTYTNLENGASVTTTVQDVGNTFNSNSGTSPVEGSVATGEGLGASMINTSSGPVPTMNGGAASAIPITATFTPGH